MDTSGWDFLSSVVLLYFGLFYVHAWWTGGDYR